MKDRCRFCHQPSLTKFLTSKKRILVQCKNCSLVFFYPFPSKKQIKAIYTTKAFGVFNPQDKTKAGYDNYLTEERLWQAFFKKRLKLIKKYKNKGKLLDLGCGVGTFLLEARQAGFYPYGVDIMEFAVKLCRKRGLKTVFQNDFSKLKFLKMSFDVITIQHTLEHLSDPLSLLRQARTLLKSKGILLVSVPDRKSIIATLMGKFWYDYYHYQHLYFFESKTLSNYIKKAGFKILASGKKQLGWCFIENALSRIRLYYSNPLLLNVTKAGETIARFINLKSIPFLNGEVWIVGIKE
ncbi:hypothetical protein A3J78_00335 [Candidatus Beckwithbacteria bacterium RBG_13_35_6]|uniref:Methyltransferase domain-containing protein n=1 Tax=Candidatus Beckwithbacteria bacterium RBG_13_35_6 TaxID=1797456 RepID=A0A1F5DHT6_9BACT|nr:MAG: hypothetical protein A3J78_00335 [Candidatus Beckwithbacteria bacterium RBG_13_35_6]